MLLSSADLRLARPDMGWVEITRGWEEAWLGGRDTKLDTLLGIGIGLLADGEALEQIPAFYIVH